jgi:ferric-dicitrate binding protein FerR (iron transport regulator)
MYNKQARELCSFEGSNKLIKEIYLKGGHHCFLAPESKIQYCRRNNLNQADTLFLEGEGYFETSQMEPLVIIAKNTVTKCMNSKLNIKSLNSSKLSIISTVKGEVNTRCTDNSFPEMKIAPSERCVVYEGGIYAAKETNDDPNYLAWKTGTLTFNNIPLAYAIRTIEDYYGVTIEVKSKDVKYCRITSEFEKTGIDEVLKYIQNSYKTKIRKSNNTIILEDGMCHLNN